MSDSQTDAKAAAHPRAEIGRERRRSMQVRQSLVAALETSPPGDSAHADLLEAAAEYMVTAMTRLDEQDMAILVRLKTRIPKDHADAHQGLVDLDGRQAKARRETNALREAIKTYRDSGRTAFAPLDAAVRHYHEVMTAMMTPRKNPYEPYTNTLFDDDDWTAIADVSEASTATEAAQFAAVKAAAPEAMDPDGFSGTHGIKPSHIPKPD